MPKDVVEFLASWPGKFRRQKWGDNGPPLFDVVYMEGEECSDFWRNWKIDMLYRCSFTLSFFIVLILSLVHVLFALFFVFVISINEVYYLSKKLNQH